MNSPILRVRIPADLLTSLKAIAEQEDRSVSNLIVVLLRRALKSWPHEVRQ